MFATTVLGATLTAAWLTFWIILVTIVWVAIALLPANVAKRKGYSFWLFFLVSLFFWWVTLFIALFLKDISPKQQSTTEQ